MTVSVSLYACLVTTADTGTVGAGSVRREWERERIPLALPASAAAVSPVAGNISSATAEQQHRDKRHQKHQQQALLAAGFLLRILIFCQSLDFP